MCVGLCTLPHMMWPQGSQPLYSLREISHQVVLYEHATNHHSCKLTKFSIYIKQNHTQVLLPKSKNE
eukprot:c37243_g1_i1 orf=315-515(+)